MYTDITMPFWVAAALCILALLGVYRYAVVPIWRWQWGRRSRHILEEVNPHLQLKLSPFTLTPRRVLADRLANDAQVQAAVAATAAERGVPVQTVQKEVQRIAYAMVPAFNPYFYFRIGYWLARGALQSLYRVRIAFSTTDALTRVKGENCVIFLMNHRSNVDYVLVSYLTAQRTMLSFGVGEWSHIWPIQPLMRAAGGYFLRRDSGDPLYRRVLERYVQMATEARVPHAIFPEGALSPDGGLQAARVGLLSYMTKTFNPATSPDIVFIPIGTNYDRVPEDRNMLTHTSAEFRKMGRGHVYKSGAQISGRIIWEMLMRKRSFGYACAQFGAPVSLADWLRNQWVDWASLDREGRFFWLNRLAVELMDEIETLIPVVPVAALAAVLLEGGGAPVSADALEDGYAEMLGRARAADAKDGGVCVIVPRKGNDEGFGHAVRMLEGRGVLKSTGEGGYVIAEGARDLVRYYAKSIEQFVGPVTPGETAPDAQIEAQRALS